MYEYAYVSVCVRRESGGGERTGEKCTSDLTSLGLLAILVLYVHMYTYVDVYVYVCVKRGGRASRKQAEKM